MWQYHDRPVVAEQPFNPNSAIYLFWFSQASKVRGHYIPYFCFESYFFFCVSSGKYVFKFSRFQLIESIFERYLSNWLLLQRFAATKPRCNIFVSISLYVFFSALFSLIVSVFSFRNNGCQQWESCCYCPMASSWPCRISRGSNSVFRYSFPQFQVYNLFSETLSMVSKPRTTLLHISGSTCLYLFIC